MNLVGLDGRVYAANLSKGRAISTGSKEEVAVAKILKEMFPTTSILREFTIPGTRLSLDFFIPWLRIAVEVQGKQHFEHVEFFHDEKIRGGLVKQQERDEEKARWAELNSIMLVCVKTGDELKEMFMSE